QPTWLPDTGQPERLSDTGGAHTVRLAHETASVPECLLRTDAVDLAICRPEAGRVGEAPAPRDLGDRPVGRRVAQIAVCAIQTHTAQVGGGGDVERSTE